MRRENSSIKVDFFSEKGANNVDRTYFACIPLENMVCYAAAESYDSDSDINSAKLAVESVITAFERNPSFRNLKKYIGYAHDQIVANSVKNRLEAAITVVVSDYTRIRYASCGNIKFYLIGENSFYLKSETQTYYQFAANEYGKDNAPVSENKNLSQYLGMASRPTPYVSRKIVLPEESTMLFATCSFWERVDDIEILDAYEESKPEDFLTSIQELYLLTQLKNPALGSYTVASLFVEKTFKEDTAKKKKRRRLIIICTAIALALAIIAFIVISIMRSSDRSAMMEIERLSSEGIRYSNTGNYTQAFEQYDRANELTGRLRNNLQYRQAKRDLSAMVAERWHLFNSIMIGNEHLESGEYIRALEAFLGAQTAYHDLYEALGRHSELMIEVILSRKIETVRYYITIDDLVKIGEMYETEEMFEEALEKFREAEAIAISVGDLDVRRSVMTHIFEVERKIQSDVELNMINRVRSLMESAENRLDFSAAKLYSEFIIHLYNDMGVTDNQALQDLERIERKIAAEEMSNEQIRAAEEALAASNYTQAITRLEGALAQFDIMGMPPGHTRYMDTVERIAQINELIDEQNIPPEDEMPEAEG